MNRHKNYKNELIYIYMLYTLGDRGIIYILYFVFPAFRGGEKKENNDYKTIEKSVTINRIN